MKLTNAFAIGINETKLNVSVFNSQVMIQDFDLVRLDPSTKEVALLLSSDTLSSKVLKPTCVIKQNIFTDIHLPKPKYICFRSPI